MNNFTFSENNPYSDFSDDSHEIFTRKMQSLTNFFDAVKYKKVQEAFDLKFLSLPIWRVPNDIYTFIYKPLRPCSFPLVGEQMVEAVLKHSTKMRSTFDTILLFEMQRKYWDYTFLSSQLAFVEKKTIPIIYHKKEAISLKQKEDLKVLYLLHII